MRTKMMRLGLLTVALVLGATATARAEQNWDYVNIREHTDPNSARLGFGWAGSNFDVFCWRDGKVASYNGQRSQRWFLVMKRQPNGNVGVIGFVTVLAFRPQPRVPRCIRRPAWPQAWGPPGPGNEIPPQSNVSTTPYPYPDSDPAPAPAPAPAPPAPTWSETTGGVAHTWTNYANAGGYEGSSIASNATVQIACKLQGFRVADGNTWWYRIASAPWNGSYYVSADAFYNNGATSGSLRGTPFVDPAVRDC